jgi:ribosomal protein L7Ae-like RNA K-turn-binding protein
MKAATKKTAKKPVIKSGKIANDIEPKEIVIAKFKNAYAKKHEIGFIIMESKSKTAKQIGSGVSKSESDAWKKAARVV